jgi:hypothetical protein
MRLSLGAPPSLLVLALVTAALGHATVRTAASSSPGGLANDVERVTLAPGERASVAGGAVELRFDRVLRDSRCPADVQCVSAGFVEIAITLTAAGASAAHTLALGGGRTASAALEQHVVTLVDVQPVPKGTRAIPASEYRAAFTVGDGAS